VKRIKAAGGNIYCNRVEGKLAISRAIGDFQYKKAPAGSKFTMQDLINSFVTPLPEVK
jgi:hypothetical protein